LQAGVVVVVTRHLGPYKAYLRGEVDLNEAAQWAAELDAAQDVTTSRADAATPPPEPAG
jgi:hypothetical protein